ncbi:bifunctional diaminohydroxyphosphoribosylaminopyrimidine deaminase/5-amino-6-(5-phosphoribosylamino)uracil reductase RibD [Candidatus Kinetoplastidibacterium crithidiae]|uniref:Riboflavin biosynthesis protein RibD n=1 Tax=Candidatus Kinetoplastidibacterium crithidiae TCC036E TaxID=1208918 RepID=M1LUV6_9PROT|nr:bifunctional diaminohydroxyphosphoribosylaminopyrimidine deaminase/5-amino-6-(5-phosphoribosylamino)uracil reductase RibD [Candidatus Kinetoplastibacterium crithidii]AFZ82880.1 diaminohydroxyphosphoribosylaminopyrimidine deaminase [Candidatus Kinetoplastibacterium crithidii (ex Angomonas deanei ATCC 30255)]AGF47881.1 diaminohydroxyphosphoribosylaminopyrimidine deaminase [Candidatus Kinetoplastibacterium crithidii TCC036E]
MPDLYNLSDEFWMSQALDLARSSICVAWPNPSVGCVIVKNNFCIGKGSTQSFGGSHAEVCALHDAMGKHYVLEGSTIYVTLEPCCHYGKTPPCVNALLKAKPKSVVIAVLDPNPVVNGKSIQILRSVGINVKIGICAEEAIWLNIGFFSRVITSLPWVRTKIATSLDGRSSLYNKKSQWITSESSRKDGHYWRARSGAILTGIGTIINDNPILTVRHFPISRQPIKAIIDDTFLIDSNSNIFDGSRVVIFTTINDKEKNKKIIDQNGEIILVDSIGKNSNKINLSSVMKWFAENCINEVHVEAGPGLNGKLLKNNSIDEMLLYFAPILIGEANTFIKIPSINELKDAVAFSTLESKLIDNDIRIRVYNYDRWNLIKEKCILQDMT